MVFSSILKNIGKNMRDLKDIIIESIFDVDNNIDKLDDIILIKQLLSKSNTFEKGSEHLQSMIGANTKPIPYSKTLYYKNYILFAKSDSTSSPIITILIANGDKKFTVHALVNSSDGIVYLSHNKQTKYELNKNGAKYIYHNIYEFPDEFMWVIEIMKSNKKFKLW